MNYMVIWMPVALQQLTTIWLASTNRTTVSIASHAIEVAIAASPHAVGTLHFDTVYEYTHLPLTVEYEVIDADRRVFVLTVWDAVQGRPAPTGN